MAIWRSPGFHPFQRPETPSSPVASHGSPPILHVLHEIVFDFVEEAAILGLIVGGERFLELLE